MWRIVVATGRSEMGQVPPSALVKIRDALLGPYPNRGAIQDLFAQADQWFDQLEKPDLELPDNLLSALRKADTHGWLSRLLRAASDGAPTDSKLAELVASYGPSNYVEGVDHFGMCKLSGGYLMIDRDPLRHSVRQLYDPAGQRILHVTGPDCSGKSYSRRLIFHVNEMLGTFTLIDIDLEEQLRMLGPNRIFFPDDLCRLLVQRLGYDDFIMAPPPAGEQWARWNLEFCRDFESRAERDPERHWIVFDAFNKVMLSDAVIDLIKELALRVSKQLFRFRMVLVGYRSSLPLDVLPTVMTDSPGPIGEMQVLEFLVRYFRDEHPKLDDEAITDRAAVAAAELLQDLDPSKTGYLIQLAPRLIETLRHRIAGP